MLNLTRFLATVVPIVVLSACASLSEADRASITAANRNAEAAMQQSAEALKASQAAQQDASAAAANAQSANEKADRMFQRSLQK